MLDPSLDIYNSCFALFDTCYFVTRDPEKMNRNIGWYFCSCFAVFPLVLQEFDNNISEYDEGAFVANRVSAYHFRHLALPEFKQN